MDLRTNATEPYYLVKVDTFFYQLSSLILIMSMLLYMDNTSLYDALYVYLNIPFLSINCFKHWVCDIL
jgi:Na+-transporting NADH:ubiquinone oxidoreductase subunit NqrE